MAGGVVDSLLVEIDGRTAKLQSALADAEVRLRKFEAATVVTSGAGQAMGERYGRAGERIAGAAAQMSAMGDISVTSGRQVLKSISDIAFGFGPQGAIVGAIGLSISAIIVLFNRAAEEAKKAREKVESEFALLQKNARAMIAAGDVGGLGKQLHQAFAGDVTDPGLVMLQQEQAALLRRQAAFRALIAKHDADMAAGKAEDVTFGLTKAQAAQLDKEVDAMALKVAAKQRDVDTLRKSVLEAIGTADRQRDIGNEGKAREDRDKELQERQKAIEAVQQAYDKLRADVSSSLTDNIAATFDAQIKAAEALTAKFGTDTTAMVAQLKTWKADAIEAATVLEDVARTQDRLVASGADIVDQYNANVASINKLRAAADDTDETSDARAKLEAKIRDLLKENAELMEKIKAAGDVSKGHSETTVTNLKEQARTINEAVNGAIQLAEAFGLVDEKTTKILRGLSQIATGIPSLIDAIKKGASGDIIASSLGIAGGLASVLSGPNSAKLLADATVALKELTRELETTREETAANPYQREILRAQADQQAQFQKLVDTLTAAGGHLTPEQLALGARDPRALGATVVQQSQEAIQRFIEQLQQAGVHLTQAQIAQLHLADPAMQAFADALTALGDSADATARKIEAERQAAQHGLEEDFAVREARLKGDNELADQLAERDRLEKEYNDAVASGLYTEEQLAHLQQLEADELAKFIADQQANAVNVTTTSSLGRGTVQQFDRVIGILQTSLAVQRDIRDVISGGQLVTSAPNIPGIGVASTITVGNPTINVYITSDALPKDDPTTAGKTLSESMYRELVRRFSRDVQAQRRIDGTDGVVS